MEEDKPSDGAEELPAEGTIEEVPPAAGDTEAGGEIADEALEKLEGNLEKVEGEQEKVEGELEKADGDQERVEGEEEKFEGEQEKVEGEEEKVEGEEEKIEGEKEEGEVTEGQEQVPVEEGEITPEGLIELGGGEPGLEDEENVEGEHVEHDEQKGEVESKTTEVLGEEEVVPEELPPDPAAPFNLSDSQEAMKLPFELSPEQLMEVENLWEMFQDHTPAYAKLDQFITPKELVYMLKALLLMTYTPEQMFEMIEFCVRPPHPENHINWEQFLKIVTMRQRDFLLEESIRQALQVFDPEHSGIVNREEIREVMETLGTRMPTKMVNNFIKEVDITGDGELGIEDIVGTMCIDLNEEDLQMLRNQVFPPVVMEEPDVNKWVGSSAPQDGTPDTSATPASEN